MSEETRTIYLCKGVIREKGKQPIDCGKRCGLSLTSDISPLKCITKKKTGEPTRDAIWTQIRKKMYDSETLAPVEPNTEKLPVENKALVAQPIVTALMVI